MYHKIGGLLRGFLDSSSEETNILKMWECKAPKAW